MFSLVRGHCRNGPAGPALLTRTVESAHAGSPYGDLGNLVRFDRAPAWTDGVLAGYGAVRGGEAAATLDLARAADLLALVELASRRAANPVAARAHDHLLAIAESEDWHAVPSSA